jgi:hypothetical protein
MRESDGPRFVHSTGPVEVDGQNTRGDPLDNVLRKLKKLTPRFAVPRMQALSEGKVIQVVQ